MRPPESDSGVRLYWRFGEDEAKTKSHTNGSINSSQATSEAHLVHGHTFDNVVLACHGDEVLPILTGEAERRRDSKNLVASRTNSSSNGSIKSIEFDANLVPKQEEDIFRAFATTENVCYLHSDLTLMPNREATWSSWNYLVNSRPSKLSHPAGVSLTYNMNILQHVSREAFGDVLVTMNPDHPPNPDLTQGEYLYRHPLYTVEAVRAQEKLEGIQNKRGVSFCGAWTKYGFHEDGFSSGLKVAVDHLGANLPFDFHDSTFSRGQTPVTGMADHIVRMVLSIMLIGIHAGEFVLRLPGVSLVLAIPTAIVAFVFDVLEHYELVN